MVVHEVEEKALSTRKASHIAVMIEALRRQRCHMRRSLIE